MDKQEMASCDTGYLIIPKTEIVEELEITFDCEDNKDFIVPKEEISHPSFQSDNSNVGVGEVTNVFVPIKIEKTLSKEVAQLQKVIKSEDEVTPTTDAESKEDLRMHIKSREMIANVYHFLKEEYALMTAANNDECDLSPLRNIRQRTADATGVSVATVTRILEEDKNKPTASQSTSPVKKRSKRKVMKRNRRQ